MDKTTAFLAAALCGAVFAAEPAALVSLNGEWRLKGWPTPERGSVRTLEEVPSETISVPAKVPGCYELDLCAAGMLPGQAPDTRGPSSFQG